MTRKLQFTIFSCIHIPRSLYFPNNMISIHQYQASRMAKLNTRLDSLQRIPSKVFDLSDYSAIHSLQLEGRNLIVTATTIDGSVVVDEWHISYKPTIEFKRRIESDAELVPPPDILVAQCGEHRISVDKMDGHTQVVLERPGQHRFAEILNGQAQVSCLAINQHCALIGWVGGDISAFHDGKCTTLSTSSTILSFFFDKKNCCVSFSETGLVQQLDLSASRTPRNNLQLQSNSFRQIVSSTEMVVGLQSDGSICVMATPPWELSNLHHVEQSTVSRPLAVATPKYASADLFRQMKEISESLRQSKTELDAEKKRHQETLQLYHDTKKRHRLETHRLKQEIKELKDTITALQLQVEELEGVPRPIPPSDLGDDPILYQPITTPCTLPCCFRIFDQPSLTHWIKSNFSCPMCREPVAEFSILPLRKN